MVWIITDDHKQFNVPVVVAQESKVLAQYIAENIYEIWLTQANNLPISSITFNTVLQYLNQLYTWHQEQLSDEAIKSMLSAFTSGVLSNQYYQAQNYFGIIPFIRACYLLKLPHKAYIEFHILNYMVHILNLELATLDNEYERFNQLFGVDDDIYYKVHEFRNREIALPLYAKRTTLSRRMPQPDYLNLSHLDLISIAGLPFIPHSDLIRFLNLSNNKISMMYPGTLRNFLHIKEINLSNNQIRMLADDIFKDKPFLETILLGNNRLSFLYNDIFENLQNLAVINLNNNQLEGLPKELFATTPNVQQLYLADNKIKDLPLTIFQSLKNLKYLDVSGNDLQYDDVTFRKKYLSHLPNVILRYVY